MKRTTTSIGQSGESQAVNWLKKHGFKILERNWKTPWCEIDIIAQRCSRGFRKRCSLHFVEVKYRKSQGAGKAIEYVTPVKQQQMIKAAEYWLTEHEWDGAWQLDVIGIDGESGVLNYIPNITLW